MIDLSELNGFDWDDGNSDKNWISHGVSAGECEELFFNLPLLLQPDPAHSQVEKRLYALGQTNAGRLLFIAFTIRGDKLRVISARAMSRKERMVYDQENS